MFDYFVGFGQLVDIDYKKYAIFYGCEDFPGIGMKKEKVYIFSRNPNVTDDARNKYV